jgi:hypothetical protein
MPHTATLGIEHLFGRDPPLPHKVGEVVGAG